VEREVGEARAEDGGRDGVDLAQELRMVPRAVQSELKAADTGEETDHPETAIRPFSESVDLLHTLDER
jgi:hypothetical protein